MHQLFSDGNVVANPKPQPTYACAYSSHWQMSCQWQWWHC